MAISVAAGQAAHATDPLGTGDPEPALTWQLRAGAGEHDVVQSAYRVQVATEPGFAGPPEADSGWIEGPTQRAPWPGPPLPSRARRWWRVMARTDGGETAWSEPWPVEAGLLEPSDWEARFITPAQPAGGADPLPASLLRRGFEVPGEVAAARLYVTALGVYEVEINGHKVGDEALAPGWTAYQARVVYRTHDVTGLVQQGANAIGATLAEGWYRGRMGWENRKDHYGDRLGLLAQLEITLRSGAKVVVASDGSWRSGRGGLVSTGLYDGETFDARLQPEAWSSAGFDDAGWAEVEILEVDIGRVEAAAAPPVRAIATLHPASTQRRPDGGLLVDFGQNLVGRLRLQLDLPAGATLTVRHAEILTADGRLRTDLLRTARATDTFVSAGAGRVEWEPRFTFHGFRYAEITGWPESEGQGGEILAVVLSSDLPVTGQFACSDERLNRLHGNVMWSLRGNFVSVPTDCPQRDERLGWTGDAQVFAPTAAFLVDAYRFLASWLRDVRLDQREDGAVPFVVPNILGAGAAGAAGWGDVITCMPWDLYMAYGDPAVLSAGFTAMCRWVDYQLDRAGDDLLWTDDFQFGDWLDPDAPAEKPASAKAKRDLVASAYMVRSLGIVSRAAALIGQPAAARRYAELTGQAAAAWWAEWGDEAVRTQTGCALALQFDLVPDGERATVAEHLALLVAGAGDHLGTGFLGTPLLLPALAAHGYADVAYRVLLQTTPPSWLYPVLLGATTIWERWDALRPDGTVPAEDLAATGHSMVSFNHYAYGAVAEWLHTTVAGIAPDRAEPGYRGVVIAPLPGGGLTWAEGRLDTAFGPVTTRWSHESGAFELEVGLPPGTRGQVRLPDGSAASRIGSGEHHFNCPLA